MTERHETRWPNVIRNLGFSNSGCAGFFLCEGRGRDYDFLGMRLPAGMISGAPLDSSSVSHLVQGRPCSDDGSVPHPKNFRSRLIDSTTPKSNTYRC